VAVWFTADTHFGHANIIRHCNRPFASAEAMDEALIAAINERVRPEDTLYHLGDFAFRSHRGLDAVAVAASYRARIRCRTVHLILGNHDPQDEDGRPPPAYAALFASTRSLARIRLPIAGMRRPVILCHYAMRVWDASHHGSWHLYGHSHGTLPDDPHARSCDVGVDAQGYAPVGVEALAAIMDRKTFVAIDSHRERPGEEA
jgi:calcineurin-like phosphoesterase family protein